MMEIYIKNQQRSTSINLKKLEEDLTKALNLLHLQSAELSVLFVNSKRMKLLNSRYRGICKDTDVLSFPLLEKGLNHGPVMLGDILVSVPRALEQAKEFKVAFHDELLRLLIHGLLHLIGYDHEINAYRKRKMEAKERGLFDAVKKMG